MALSLMVSWCFLRAASLVHVLHGDLVSHSGFILGAFRDSGIKLLQCGLHSGDSSLVTSGLGLVNQHALFSGLDIGQTKNLLY